MKPDPLDQQLVDLARESLPSPPVRLTSNIWDEIERRRRQSIWARVFAMLDWREMFTEPHLTVVAVAFAVVVGVFPAALIGRAENQSRIARQSIHFDVFAMD